MPSCSRARGREPSITTSADSSSSRSRARPASVDQSSVTKSAPACNWSKNSGCRRPPSGRPTLSTLVTCAPSRWRSCPVSGPAHSEARLTTRAPATGRPRAGPRCSATIRRRSVCSPTTAHARPRSVARSTSSVPERERTCASTTPHGSSPRMSGSTLPSSSHAGIAVMSSGRASETAIHPSAARSRRQAPPLLTVPAGGSPSSRARSVNRPRPSAPNRSANAAPRSSSRAVWSATYRHIAALPGRSFTSPCSSTLRASATSTSRRASTASSSTVRISTRSSPGWHS